MVRWSVSYKFLSSFHIWFRGQDAASEAHHCRNTNVVCNTRPTNYSFIPHSQAHLHCRTSDTQTKAMQKSLPLPTATDGQNRGLKSKTREFNFGSRTKFSLAEKIDVRWQWKKTKLRTKFNNMSADNLPRWTKFEPVENSETLKSKTEFTFRLHFFTSDLPSWKQKSCRFIDFNI